MAEKVVVYKLTNVTMDGEWLAVTQQGLDAIQDAIIDSDPGTKYTIEVEEWEKGLLDELPEWDGW